MSEISDLSFPADAERVANFAQLLAHPLRVRILQIVGESDASASELAPVLGASVNALAYHLHLLAAGGALEVSQTTQVRGATRHTWRLTPVARIRLDEIRRWLGQDQLMSAEISGRL